MGVDGILSELACFSRLNIWQVEDTLLGGLWEGLSQNSHPVKYCILSGRQQLVKPANLIICNYLIVPPSKILEPEQFSLQGTSGGLSSNSPRLQAGHTLAAD